MVMVQKGGAVGAPAAQPEREWVGLRPGRTSVRLEYEEVDLAHHGGQGTLRVVHNYGAAAQGACVSGRPKLSLLRCFQRATVNGMRRAWRRRGYAGLGMRGRGGAAPAAGAVSLGYWLGCVRSVCMVGICCGRDMSGVYV